MADRKKKVCSTIAVFSAVTILRTGHANLHKEEEPKVKVEPVKVEEIEFEKVFQPADREELDRKIQEYLDKNSVIVIEEPTTTTIQNEDNFEETNTTTRAK